MQEFEIKLIDNILALHRSLMQSRYMHGGYKEFVIHDPKQRLIHKAIVRDRLLHHAVFRVLYPYFDRTFICDSYSSRKDKGTHRAIKSFRIFIGKVSQNNTRTCWVLKCDIRKFFASVDHSVLLEILKSYIDDDKAMHLLTGIISSYNSEKNIGLPLGNLTSQLLVNIYMNEFDQFMKHKLKVKYYVRYADDFVILSNDKEYLLQLKQAIGDFLGMHLRLELHPKKTVIRTVASGVDFLGYVVFPKYVVLRTETKRRMLKKVSIRNIDSYHGIMKHCNGYGLEQKVRKIVADQELKKEGPKP